MQHTRRHLRRPALLLIGLPRRDAITTLSAKEETPWPILTPSP